MATIQLRIDNATKKSAKQILDKIGIDMSSAIKIYLKQIDLFIKTGEFLTRSEVIRHAVNEYISNHAGRIIEKADKLKKVQELGAAVEALEPYMKK